MIVLGIETSGRSFSLALAEDGIVKSKLFIDDSRVHSMHLVSTMDKFLDGNNTEPEQIDAIAVDIGPGSFTGIRVGVSAARALAQSLNIKLAGVSSLESLAYGARLWEGIIVPVIPAVKGEIYCSVYKSRNSAPVRICGEAVLFVEELESIVKKYSIRGRNLLFCGSAVEIYESELICLMKKSAREISLDKNHPHAEDVAALGWKKIVNSRRKNGWEGVLPSYIKLPQAVRRLNEKNG